MKKKTKLLIALLLVFVGVGLTYAVYTTSVGGNANVESANWLIKVKTGSDFDNQAGIDVSNGATDINLGSCQKLAPGGSCTLPFRVDATGTEVDTILTVELGSNVSGATLEELTNAGINLRISDGVNEDYAYLLNMGSYKDLNLVINWEAGDEDDDTKAGYDVSIANKLSSITIPVNMIVKQRLGGTRTVTFNTHDSNIETPESIQVNDGETISNIPSLSKNGYIFVGWFTSENGGVQLTSSTPIIDNIEYHARFREPQNLTVSFNTHGGSNVNSVNVLEGGTLSELPSSPTKLGYTFAGWYTAETGGEAVTTSTVINNITEFHAQWTIKYVSVTFDSAGGSSVAAQQVQEGSTINPLPTTTKEGGEFVGWYDSSNQLLTISTQIMNDITYTARFVEPWLGRLVYFDPVSTAKCDSSTFDLNAVKNGSSTCYKWRVIDTEIDNNESKSNITIQLDHNIVNKVEWNASDTSSGNTLGPVKSLTSLKDATYMWTRVNKLNYTYDTTSSSQNYGELACSNGICEITKTGVTIGTDDKPLRARLIEAEEIANITKEYTNGTTIADSWSLANQNESGTSVTYFYFAHNGYIIGTKTSASGQGSTTLKWLLENTSYNYYGLGNLSNQYAADNSGYWTLSPSTSDSRKYNALIVNSSGNLYATQFWNGNFGIRPVITVPKSDLSFN